MNNANLLTCPSAARADENDKTDNARARARQFNTRRENTHVFYGNRSFFCFVFSFYI